MFKVLDFSVTDQSYQLGVLTGKHHELKEVSLLH